MINFATLPRRIATRLGTAWHVDYVTIHGDNEAMTARITGPRHRSLHLRAHQNVGGTGELTARGELGYGLPAYTGRRAHHNEIRMPLSIDLTAAARRITRDILTPAPGGYIDTVDHALTAEHHAQHTAITTPPTSREHAETLANALHVPAYTHLVRAYPNPATGIYTIDADTSGHSWDRTRELWTPTTHLRIAAAPERAEAIIHGIATTLRTSAANPAPAR
ncbi:hypothetical protein [Nocardia sp. IFM 10818]